jgi:hypothetical protein
MPTHPTRAILDITFRLLVEEILGVLYGTVPVCIGLCLKDPSQKPPIERPVSLPVES